MTIRDLTAALDKPAMLRLTAEGITIPVIIKDIRNVFGRTDFQVAPVDGKGLVWVNSERVTVKE